MAQDNAQVKIGIERLTIPQKIAKARTLATALTGNAYIANPDPTPAQINAA